MHSMGRTDCHKCTSKMSKYSAEAARKGWRLGAGGHLNQAQKGVLGHTWLERWKKAGVRWGRGVDRAQRHGHGQTDYRKSWLSDEGEAPATFLF